MPFLFFQGVDIYDLKLFNGLEHEKRFDCKQNVNSKSKVAKIPIPFDVCNRGIFIFLVKLNTGGGEPYG